MNKLFKLSAIASLVINSSLFALDIDIHKGWNEIGISSKGIYNIKDIIDPTKIEVIYGNGSFYDPLNPDVSTLLKLEEGKAYWIKAKDNFIIKIGDDLISLDDLKIGIGWNFIAIPSVSMSSFKDFVQTKKGLKVDVIYGNGSFYDPLNPDVSTLTTSENGKGYWVKTSKAVGKVKTLDGYEITLFSSKSASVDSAILDIIKNSTLEDLFTISDWGNITSIIINDKKEFSTLSLNSINVDDVKKELAGDISKTASLYVYGISEGSAPYALADALVYKINEDGSLSLIGYTGEDGFIYDPSLTKGTKILIKKDGMDDKIYTINTTDTNYVFMSTSDALELVSENPDTTSSRLHYISETFKRKGNVGYYRPSSSTGLKKYLPVRRIKPVSIEALDDSSSLKSLINNAVVAGYEPNVLASFDFYLKIAKKLGGKGYAPFSDFYDGVDPYITVALPGVNYYDIKSALEGKGGILKLFYFDGTSWKERVLKDGDVTIKKIADEPTKIRKSYAKAFDINTPVLEIRHTGFYPHVVVLDKKVVFKYPLNINVVDKDGNKLDGAAVFISGRFVGVTDKDGNFEYDLTAGYDASNFNIKIMKSGFKSNSKLINISSLKENTTNNIDFTLEKVSNVASIEGYIYDSKTSKPVYLANVNLYFPYSLAYVTKDEKGITVGYQPNTNYKWYVKIHDDTTSTSGLGRVSAKRWLLVKEANSNEHGNFLSYDEIKRMIVAAKNTDDPEDVKSMVSGLFDIALVAEHDIDGDGKVDFVELAATKDKVGTDLTPDVDDAKIDDYAKIIGTIKFKFDVEKLKDISNIDADLAPSVKVDGKWYNADDDFDDYKKYVGLLDEGVVDDDYSFGIEVRKDLDYFDERGLSPKINENNYTLKYQLGIISDLTTKVTKDSKTVALVKEGDNYVWKLVPNDANIYQYLEDKGAVNTLGIRKFNATEKKFIIYDTVTYNDIADFVSRNKLMDKLNMTLSQIAEEAGASDEVRKAIEDSGDVNTPLIKTGMTLVPLVELNTKNKDGKDITLIGAARIELPKIDDITSYILRGDVNVVHPVSAPTVLKDKTDRSGKFIFSKLPLEYAKLEGKDISMLTLAANKYAYYPSPLINIKSYEAGDVENIKIKLEPKAITSVNVKVIDVDTNKSIDANISIDGQYREVKSVLDDFKEYTSIESKIGSNVKFDDILVGIRTVTVSKDGYYPVTISKPVYASSTNEILVKLKKASSIDSLLAPTVAINDYEIKDGSIILYVEGSDNKDGTLTKDKDGFISKLLVFDNGEKINPIINMSEDGNIKVIINTPRIGENNIFVKLVNPKGEAKTTPITINFYPAIGSVKGYVSKFTDENLDAVLDDGHLLIVYFYDKSMNFIQAILANKDGSYLNPKLPVGEVYVKAKQLNAIYGTLEKESDFEKVVVAPGIIKSVNLELKDVDSHIRWVPIVDFDPSISEADLEEEAKANDGNVIIKGKVYYYDPKGKLFVVVNGNSYELNESELKVDDEDKGIYYYSKTIKLFNGTNEIYVKALNPNGFFDTTPILTVNYGSVSKYIVDFKVIDENTTEPIAYASINITNRASSLYDSIETNESGEAIYELPSYEDMAYIVNVSAIGYKDYVTHLTNLEELDKKDGKVDYHITYDIKMIPDSYMPDWYIEKVDYSQSGLSFELPDGSLAKDKEVEFIIKSSDGKEHNYKVIIKDGDGNIINSFEVKGNKFTYSFDKEGNYEISITDEKGLITPFVIYINVSSLEDIIPKPPVAPIIPTPTVK